VTRLKRALSAGVLAAFDRGPAAADGPAPHRNWQAEKRSRYVRDWNEALRHDGQGGLSAEFVARNAAFIQSGCLSLDKVCPRTGKYRQFADVLAIRVVNEGMSTTVDDLPALRLPALAPPEVVLQRLTQHRDASPLTAGHGLKSA
jgi:hypothetical protein